MAARKDRNACMVICGDDMGKPVSACNCEPNLQVYSPAECEALRGTGLRGTDKNGLPIIQAVVIRRTYRGSSWEFPEQPGPGKTAEFNLAQFICPWAAPGVECVRGHQAPFAGQNDPFAGRGDIRRSRCPRFIGEYRLVLVDSGLIRRNLDGVPVIEKENKMVIQRSNHPAQRRRRLRPAPPPPAPTITAPRARQPPALPHPVAISTTRYRFRGGRRD